MHSCLSCANLCFSGHYRCTSRNIWNISNGVQVIKFHLLFILFYFSELSVFTLCETSMKFAVLCIHYISFISEKSAKNFHMLRRMYCVYTIKMCFPIAFTLTMRGKGKKRKRKMEYECHILIQYSYYQVKNGHH